MDAPFELVITICMLLADGVGEHCLTFDKRYESKVSCSIGLTVTVGQNISVALTRRVALIKFNAECEPVTEA